MNAKIFRIVSVLLVLMLLTLSSAGQLRAQTSEALSGQAASVYVIPIQGDIEASTPVFVQRRVKEALSAGASSIIFTIDTFGGRVDSALRVASIIGALRGVETIAFVGGGEDNMGVSWSAGVLIALACQKIYMAPGTSIGAAAPVLAAPDGSMEAADEKVVSAVRSQMAALAEKNGHPIQLVLAMVDADVSLVEVFIDDISQLMEAEQAGLLAKDAKPDLRIGRTIVAEGKLLSLTAGEALRYGLSSGTVPELPALVAELGFEADAVITSLEPGWADGLIMFLTSAAVQSILILIGLVALFIEINSPGFGLPGSIALIAFVILFGSNLFMGTVGSLELILFILGIGLLIIEIFVLPGFGFAGISGIVFIAAALVLSMQDFVLPDANWQWDILLRNLATVGLGILSAIVGIGLLIAFGPRLHLFDGLTLKTRLSATASGDSQGGIQRGPQEPSQTESNNAQWPALGSSGVAMSVLRPVGRARINGLVYSVESEGTYIEAGTLLTVCGIHGNVIIVRQTDPDLPK